MSPQTKDFILGSIKAVFKGCGFFGCKPKEADFDLVIMKGKIYEFYCKRCGGSVLCKLDDKSDDILYVDSERLSFDDWCEEFDKQQKLEKVE